MSLKCPHITNHVSSILEIKKIKRDILCEKCKNAGPNLWICMQKNCLRVGCSEQANDHSTEHFKLNNAHCVHMNLSSQRMWCYLCEKEVRNERHLANDPFDMTDTDKSESFRKCSNENNDSTNIRGLVGLQNIANTCYMNSALQALSNIQPLTYYFLDCEDLVEHAIDLAAYRSKSGLAKSYLRLIKDIWCRNSRVKDYIAPRGILYGIRSVHPMFRGFQQHDTQEFLRCFMDQLHEELKELSPRIPLDSCDNSTDHPRTTYRSRSSQQKIADEQNEQTLNLQNESASQSEAEYETCDSGVSEQSSLFDNSLMQDIIYADRMQMYSSAAANIHKVNLERSNTSWCQKKLTESNASQANSLHRSIISDVFDGKLLSSVQCLTCDRVSTREETFQDLSLPIPNRDYLNVLHQTHSLSAQSINSIGFGVRATSATGSELVKNEGWLAWMWNILRSWLWGPSVTLHDCMASFFSADELKGDNMYSCEKCNKLRTGVKYSRILNLPEALCIHLKRFRHDLSYSSKISSYINFPMECFDMQPYLHKECKSNVSLYNLVSVICHYGTVGGGHYTCFAKNNFTNKWYEFDDQHVTEVSVDTVQSCQAYVLFYRKRNSHMDLIRAEARDISNSNPSHVSDIRFYVSREWIFRLNTFAEPGPINNWAILCPHGGVPPYKIDVMNKIALPISQQLWDYLYKKFGGGPAINMLFECEVCKKIADILLRRQKYELSIFTKYNEMKDSNAIYAISMSWLRKWQLFARGLTNKEPGPITNSVIAASTDGFLTPPIRNVKSGSDYAQLNAPLWRFLHTIYGGGPEIILRENFNEEIEIVDQDEYDSKAGNTHLETESILEQRKTNTSQLNATVQMDENESNRVGNFSSDPAYNESDIKMQFIKPTISTKQDFRSQKHFTVENKKFNLVGSHSASQKRTKRRRNAMRNDGFFGPNGNYNFNKSDENSEEPIMTIKVQENIKKIPNAFNKKSKQPFQSDKINSNGEMDRPNPPCDMIFNKMYFKESYKASRRKSKSKGKDRTTFRQHEPFDKSSESSETAA